MEFYISPQSGQFYMINVLENQWLSVTYEIMLPSSDVGGMRIYEIMLPSSDVGGMRIYGLQATNSSARPDVSIEKSQGFQTVRCLIGC